MIKIINISCFNNGKAIFKDVKDINKDLPVIYQKESESTALRFYFENKLFLNPTLYKQVITVKNKNIIHSYDVSNSNSYSEYILKQQDISLVGDLIVTLEIYKLEEVNVDPSYLLKFVVPTMQVKSSDGSTVVIDWQKNYEDTFEQETGGLLVQEMLNAFVKLQSDVNLLKTEDTTNDDLIAQVQQDINSINTIIQIIQSNINTFSQNDISTQNLINDINTNITSISNNITSLQNKDTLIDNSITTINEKDSSQDEEITNLKDSQTALENSVNGIYTTIRVW